MRRFLFVFITAILISINGFTSEETDTVRVKDIGEYYCPSDRIDSLLMSWFYHSGRDSLDFFSYSDVENLILEVADSVLLQRIKNIPTPIELTFNNLVKRYIDRYVIRGRWMAPKFLGLSLQYFPLFEEKLDAHGLPLELKYLPIIESALNPNAVSRAGATGMWQIMYRTGLSLGLEINSYVDERRDIYKSTEAACIYLRQLYDTYGCWNLTLAAYNCGPGCVNNAIRRSRGKTNYWELLPYLPRETRNYVPAFIAVTYLFSYYEEHNYKPEFIDFIYDYDTVMVSRKVHFAQIDSVLSIGIDELRELNPQYRKDVIPATEKAYPLRIRRKFISDFIRLEDSIYNFKDSVFFNPKRFEYQPDEKLITRPRIAPQPEGTVALTYTVKSGDVVGRIASWYGVSAADLRAWNGISRNLIRVGQTLNVYVPEALESRYRLVDNMSFEEKQRMIGIETEPKQETASTTVTGYDYYEVQRGDSPWTIANKYPGVSVEDILRANGLNSSSRLSVGQRIKIPRKG